MVVSPLHIPTWGHRQVWPRCALGELQVSSKSALGLSEKHMVLVLSHLPGGGHSELPNFAVAPHPAPPTQVLQPGQSVEARRQPSSRSCGVLHRLGRETQRPHQGPLSSFCMGQVSNPAGLAVSCIFNPGLCTCTLISHFHREEMVFVTSQGGTTATTRPWGTPIAPCSRPQCLQPQHLCTGDVMVPSQGRRILSARHRSSWSVRAPYLEGTTPARAASQEQTLAGCHLLGIWLFWAWELEGLLTV